MSSNQPTAGNINDKQGSSTPSPDDIVKAFDLMLDGEECIEAYKYKEAIEKFTQAIALYPAPVHYCRRAAIYSMLVQYGDAINDCRASIELDPKYANAYCILVLAFDALHRYDEAIEAFKKALELDPGNEGSRIGLAHAEKKQKSSPPASEAISKANDLKEEGKELMKPSKFKEAVETYTEAIVLKSDPVYYCNSAAAFCRLMRYDNAQFDCFHALSLDANYAKAHARMGFIFSCLGIYFYSANAYKKALELDRNNQSYKENLALAQAKVREANFRS